MRPTVLIRAIRLLSIATLRDGTADAKCARRSFSPQRSIWPTHRPTHILPPPAQHFPASRRRWSAAASPRSPSELALRAIRHPDACERLTPLVVLFWMSVVMLKVEQVSKNGGVTRCAGVLLLVLPIFVVLPLGILRPIGRIPAFAENEDSNPPPAARRSLSSTHFAQIRQQFATEKGRGRCAPRAVRPEACGLLSAPLRRWRREPSIRKQKARLLTQTRNLMPPAPEGSIIRKPVCPEAAALPAPHGIT